MMLRHSLGLEAEAAAIENAVDETITAGARTADLGGKLNTRQMADEIIKRCNHPCPFAKHPLKAPGRAREKGRRNHMGMESKYIWMDGELVAFEKATIHIS
jgi:hypothetical protein